MVLFRDLPAALARRAALVLPFAALLNLSCQKEPSSTAPSDYLLVTHSALNRLTIFDLATNTIIGALPTHKLPHDMLISPDGVLTVVNSGSQCITTYDLRKPEFWSYAREFIKKDSANLFAGRTPSANITGRSQGMQGSDAAKDTAAWTNLNRDPVQALPATFARTYLTDPRFPEAARPMHEKVNAMSHSACYDCHDRSMGAKPFGPAYSKDSSEITLVHLRSRDITVLDSKTFAVKRQIPLPLPVQFAPIEAWISPDQRTCFVTCRNEIGESKPGRILVVDLRDGSLTKSIMAGIYPWHLMADPSGKTLYVNNFQSSRISIVDVERKEIVDSIIVQNGPSMMKLLPDQNQLVVSCFYTDRVLFVDLKTNQVTTAIEVDANPTSLELSPDGKTLYVLCGGESSLNVIDVPSGTVRARHTMLFGAYAFLAVHNRSVE